MLTHISCNNFSTEEKVIKAFKKFIEAGIEKIADLPTGIPYLGKRESISYLENKNVIETSYSLMNVFNVEFASTAAYLIPFIDLPWSNQEGLHIPNSLQHDLIKSQMEDLFKLETEIQILKEGFSNSFNELFDIMTSNKSKLIEKDFGLLYLPCFDIKEDYTVTFLHYIIVNTIKQLFFVKNKSFIMKIDSDLSELFSSLKIIPSLGFTIECLDSNKDRTYLLIS